MVAGKESRRGRKRKLNNVKNTAFGDDLRELEKGNPIDSSSLNGVEAKLEVEVPLVPPPELPPSSGHIGVPEEYVPHLLSVYSFLRSFSVRLFLYPFELDSFVGALNCPVSNTLLDSVHVALMCFLKRQLEKGPSDGPELASKVLRCLDWSLLDTLTWPMYLVHYLMGTCYNNGDDWKDLFAHCLERDYYTLPAGKKLTVLQILCDSVLDTEELRAEMDMREQSEAGIDIETSTDLDIGEPASAHPRCSKSSDCKNKEATQSVEKHHSMESQIGSAVEDDNGDECRLCGMDGVLICCDGCPSAYHSRCLGLNKMLASDGSWYCPECTVDASEPKILRRTTLRGGDVVGLDPYKHVFVASCDHLLVVKTSITSESCPRYYNRHDIPRVLNALNAKPEYATVYSKICRGIMLYWELSTDILHSNKKSGMDVKLPDEEGSILCNTQCGNMLEKVSDMTEVGNHGTCASGTSSQPNNNNMTEALSTRSSNSLYMGSSFNRTAYSNHYVHGDFSASAAAIVLESHSSDIQQNVMMHASLALQEKAFSSAAARFFWPNVEKKFSEVPRERCSWCLSCKGHVTNKRACLLNAAASNAIRGTMKILSGVRRVKSGGDERLSSMATYIIFMEESLRGVLVGPFLNDTFRKQWRRQLELATTCSEIKILLLELEENVRFIAFSGDWTKLVEGFPSQSSTSQIATGSTQKSRPGRRGKKQPDMAEVGADGFLKKSNDFTWWRGSVMSKLMFQRGILPSSNIKKPARQGGKKKIPGVRYVEGNEIPRISRQLVWRSAVEISRTLAHLALQVRYLDLHLRWGDLGRPEQIPSDGKSSEAEVSAFRNAFICGKKIVEQKVRYGVDFGSRKHLPSRVMKNIIEIEQIPGAGKERYWFSETFIPLYLIREYEQKVEKNKSVNVFSRLHRRQLKASNENIFSLLSWKQGNTARSCCSCHQDVCYRNAVKCHACQGFCHQQCTATSTVNMSGEIDFFVICKQCHETQASTRVDNSSNGSTTSPLLLQRQDVPNPAITKDGNLVCSEGPSSSFAASKHCSSEVKSIKSKTATKKNTKSNWGLVWKKNNSEDNGFDFRSKNIILKGNMDMGLIKPICHLCNQPYNAGLMYIRCDTCTHWFHADAIELDESKIFTLTGFKCCKCRKIKSPVCPYFQPKNKALKGKISHQQASNLEISALDFIPGLIPDHNKEVPIASESLRKAEGFHVPAANNPLPASPYEAKQCTEGKSEGNNGWNVSDPESRKARSHVHREKYVLRQEDLFQLQESSHYKANGVSSTEDMSMRRSPTKETKVASNSIQDAEANAAFSVQEMLHHNDYFDLGFDFGDHANGMSLPEILTEDGNIWSSVPSNGTPEASLDQEKVITSTEASNQIVACKVCSKTEPSPDRCCSICGIIIHKMCSPWFESLSSSSHEDGWRCGCCRDWS